MSILWQWQPVWSPGSSNLNPCEIFRNEKTCFNSLTYYVIMFQAGAWRVVPWLRGGNRKLCALDAYVWRLSIRQEKEEYVCDSTCLSGRRHPSLPSLSPVLHLCSQSILILNMEHGKMWVHGKFGWQGTYQTEPLSDKCNHFRCGLWFILSIKIWRLLKGFIKMCLPTVSREMDFRAWGL